MHIKDLQLRVNEKRKAIGLPEKTDEDFLQDVTAMQLSGKLKIENGDVTVIQQYPTMIYRSAR